MENKRGLSPELRQAAEKIRAAIRLDRLDKQVKEALTFHERMKATAHMIEDVMLSNQDYLKFCRDQKFKSFMGGY